MSYFINMYSQSPEIRQVPTSEYPMEDSDLQVPTTHLTLPETSSGRVRRFPQQYRDYLPSSTTQVPPMPPPVPRRRPPQKTRPLSPQHDPDPPHPSDHSDP